MRPPSASVLLVEDDDIAASVFEGLLAEVGLSVVRVRSVAQALEELRASTARLAVWADLDLGQPEDGVLVLQAARGLQPGALRLLVTAGTEDGRVAGLPPGTLVFDKVDATDAVTVLAAAARVAR